MAGRPGRSGGHNKIDPRQHVLRGTFNATRHRAALEANGPTWHADPTLLSELGEDGRRFVVRLTRTYDLNPWEGELLLEAAIAVDRLAQIRTMRGDCTLKERLALDKCEQLWQKQLSELLLSLRVRS